MLRVSRLESVSPESGSQSGSNNKFRLTGGRLEPQSRSGTRPPTCQETRTKILNKSLRSSKTPKKPRLVDDEKFMIIFLSDLFEGEEEESSFR